MWSDPNAFHVQEIPGYGEFLNIPQAERSVDILDDMGWGNPCVAEHKLTSLRNANIKVKLCVAIWQTSAHTRRHKNYER